MSRKFLQSFVIVLVFVLSVIAVLLLGLREGKTVSMKTQGVELSEKIAWEDAVQENLPEEDPMVYLTESGTKYHVSKDCSSLKRSKNIQGTLLSNAEQQGKTPCSICYGK